MSDLNPLTSTPINSTVVNYCGKLLLKVSLSFENVDPFKNIHINFTCFVKEIFWFILTSAYAINNTTTMTKTCIFLSHFAS